MNKERGRFTGILQILRFNWPFYVAAILIASVAWILLFLFLLPDFLKILFQTFIFFSLFWTCSSLIVSYWVYDRSPLYQWNWILKYFPPSRQEMANIHAGFDESSEKLRLLFPEARWKILDIYRSTSSTGSLERARNIQDSSSEKIDPRALPFPEASFDGLFLIFAAHEIRETKVRLKFFEELHRVLKPQGKILLVEHLRDFANFLAFGPNFLHFFSRKEWLRCIESASFKMKQEFNITPFVNIFILEKV